MNLIEYFLKAFQGQPTHVAPICLPTADVIENIKSSSALKVAGWGRLSEKSNNKAHILQQVTVSIIDPSICMDSYKTVQKGKIYDGQFSDSVLCAG